MSPAPFQPTRPAPDSWRGPRVRLARPAVADVARLHEWFLAAPPARLTCRPVPAAPTPDEAVARFRLEGDRSPTGELLVVRRLADDVLLGRVRHFDWNSRNGALEIGYLVGAEHRGQGYAREALGLFLTYLFESWGARKVMAQTGAFNLPSRRLLHALGFHQDGRLRAHHELDGELYDDVLFSLLKEEYVPLY